MIENCYVPKGGMCVGCTHFSRSCNHLDFRNMPPIERSPDGVVVVKCTEYVKREDV